MTDYQDVQTTLTEFYALLPGEVTSPETLADRVSIKGAFTAVWQWMAGDENTFFLSLFSLFGIALFFFLAETVSVSGEVGTISQYGLSIVFGTAVFSLLFPLLEALFGVLREATAFFGAVLPFLFGIGVSSGGAKSAGAMYLCGQTLLWFCEKLVTGFMPLETLLCSLSLFSFLSPVTSRLASWIRKAVVTALGFIGAVFSAVLSFQTVLQNAADSVSIRTAKYTLSQMIPIVGSTVSSAVSTLAGAMTYLKSTVGAISIYAVLILILPLFLRLLLFRMVLSLCHSFLSVSKTEGVESLLSSFSGVADTAIGISAFCFTLFVFSFALFMMSGVAVLR